MARGFPWGDKATDGRVFAASVVWTGVVMTLAIKNMGASGPAAELGVSLSTPGVRRCVLASLGWVLMMLNSYGLQVFLRLGKQNFSSKALGGAERVVYNSLEHAPAFLMLMWLHCILVDADQAGYLGMVYVAHRFVYGIFFSAMGQFTFLCESCTQPGYAVIYYFGFSLLTACFPEHFSPFQSYLPANPYILAPAVMLVNTLLFNIVWGFPTGYLNVELMNRAHPYEKGKGKTDEKYGHLHEE